MDDEIHPQSIAPQDIQVSTFIVKACFKCPTSTLDLNICRNKLKIQIATLTHAVDPNGMSVTLIKTWPAKYRKEEILKKLIGEDALKTRHHQAARTHAIIAYNQCGGGEIVGPNEIEILVNSGDTKDHFQEMEKIIGRAENGLESAWKYIGKSVYTDPAPEVPTPDELKRPAPTYGDNAEAKKHKATDRQQFGPPSSNAGPDPFQDYFWKTIDSRQQQDIDWLYRYDQKETELKSLREQKDQELKRKDLDLKELHEQKDLELKQKDLEIKALLAKVHTLGELSTSNALLAEQNASLKAKQARTKNKLNTARDELTHKCIELQAARKKESELSDALKKSKDFQTEADDLALREATLLIKTENLEERIQELEAELAKHST